MITSDKPTCQDLPARKRILMDDVGRAAAGDLVIASLVEFAVDSPLECRGQLL